VKRSAAATSTAKRKSQPVEVDRRKGGAECQLAASSFEDMAALEAFVFPAKTTLASM
jgi:hypothetical protein